MEAKLGLTRGFPEELYRERYAKAKSTQICMCCGAPVGDLNSAASRLEYSISALCEPCRDQIICSCLNKARKSEPSNKVG